MNSDNHKHGRPELHISADLKALDAVELIREALDCRLRLRQVIQQLHDGFGYIVSSTYEKLESVAKYHADTEHLDEMAMRSVLDGISRHGEPDPAPKGRLLGL